jgi:AcrR family transcriptional regulator
MMGCGMERDASIEGLRERKKRETRAALAWSAVRLSVEHGFATVTVEDIAASAGVSARTFNNYFSSKAEAVVARHIDRLQGTAAELRARSKTEPLWTAISEAAITAFLGDEEGDRPTQQWVAGVTLLVAEPAVEAEFLRQSRICEREIAAAVKERIGGDADALHAHLVAAAVGAAIQVTIEEWLQATRPASLRQALRMAFDRMGRISDLSSQS